MVSVKRAVASSFRSVNSYNSYYEIKKRVARNCSSFLLAILRSNNVAKVVSTDMRISMYSKIGYYWSALLSYYNDIKSHMDGRLIPYKRGQHTKALSAANKPFNWYMKISVVSLKGRIINKLTNQQITAFMKKHISLLLLRTNASQRLYV